jgi:hypothetical protein
LKVENVENGERKDVFYYWHVHFTAGVKECSGIGMPHACICILLHIHIYIWSRKRESKVVDE